MPEDNNGALVQIQCPNCGLLLAVKSIVPEHVACGVLGTDSAAQCLEPSVTSIRRRPWSERGLGRDPGSPQKDLRFAGDVGRRAVSSAAQTARSDTMLSVVLGSDASAGRSYHRKLRGGRL